MINDFAVDATCRSFDSSETAHNEMSLWNIGISHISIT